MLIAQHEKLSHLQRLDLTRNALSFRAIEQLAQRLPGVQVASNFDEAYGGEPA